MNLLTNISYELRHKNLQQNVSRQNSTMYTDNYTPRPSGIFFQVYNAGSTLEKSIHLVHHISKLKGIKSYDHVITEKSLTIPDLHS